MSRWRSPRLWTMGLVTFALLTRLGAFCWVYAAEPERIMKPDSITYEQPALAILEQGRFLTRNYPDSAPEIMRTPGYPLFIAAVYAVAGPSRVALIVAQILISCATIGLTWMVARKLWRSETAAALTVGLIAFDGVSFHASQVMLTETLFTFLIMLAALVSLGAVETGGRPRPWVLLGVSLALVAATFVRPVTYYFIAPLTVWAAGLLIVHRARALPWAICMAMVLLPWLIGVGGWQWRNHAQAGSGDFSHIKHINLYFYRAADVIAREEGLALAEAQQRLETEADERTRALNDTERYAYYKRSALQTLKRRPDLAAVSMATGAARLMAGPGTASLYEYMNGALDRTALKRLDFGALRGSTPLLGLALAQGLVMLGMYAGATVAGLRAKRLARSYPATQAMLLLLGLYLIAVSAGPEANSRFRTPLIPILSIYGGWGLWQLGQWAAGMKRPASLPRPASFDDSNSKA